MSKTMPPYEKRIERIKRCKTFVKIEGTEWAEFYWPLLQAAEHGNGGGFDEDAEVLVRFVENAIDILVINRDYSQHYGDSGGPELENMWKEYRKDNPSLPIIDPALVGRHEDIDRRIAALE